MTSGARTAWIDNARVALDLSALIGQGGEAEVYDLGDGRVLKWWKPSDHPDFAGLPELQDAALQRLAERPARLAALPALPAEVVAPIGVARASKRGAVIGYVMPRVDGEPLHSFGEPRWRRDHPVDGNDVIAALLALHDAIDRLHRLGVVIGDCNDLNVLVELPRRRVHLIDVDSYQLPGYPCPMFSERFVDPRLCDARLQLCRPHDAASDWYAFAVMAFRSLFGVSPWGGVTRRCTGAARIAQRISVYASDVVYPRAARPLAIIPDELTHIFRAIFERDERGVFPRRALEQLQLRRCASCGDEHARMRCPSCATAIPPVTVVHGRLRSQAIAARDVALAGYAVTATTPVWLDGGALYRRIPAGRALIGRVLPGLTRAWAGARLGVGFYRAGGYAVGFVFRPEHGVLDDSVALPAIRGQLLDAHATIGDDRAWLWLTSAQAGRITTTCVVIGGDARVIACEAIGDAPWLAGIAGACAAGPHLFVPTDDGVVRIEVAHGAIVQTRRFAETAPLIASSDRLALHPEGLDAIRRHDAIRMQLS